jgi:hypothetical protein
MLQCLAAVANEALCESLAQKLPVSVNFLNYVAIVMLAKNDLRFKVLSAEGTQLVENTRNARAQCFKARRCRPIWPKWLS